MNKSEEEKLLSRYMDVWILYILRTQSDDENPMTVDRIVDRISELTGLGENSIRNGEKNPIAKTVSRRLQEFETMGNRYSSGSNLSYNEAFYRVIGGQIKALDTRPVSYYFDPVLNAGDVSMICAAIESNHFLSPEETEYLIRRENAALSYAEGEKEILSYRKDKSSFRLPRRPETASDPSLPPSKASVTLKKFTLIQYAIRHQFMLRVIPGTYKSENGKIRFVPKRQRESFLNPYAMICQNGQYYIIATHEGYDNPVHYRVDRLYFADLVRDTGSKRAKFKKREEIPVKLQKFFKGRKFDADRYTAKYPLMAYYDAGGFQKCEFVCLKDAVTVAIDYFGAGDSVLMEEFGDGDKYVKFTVFADYDNVKMFCAQQYSIVKPLSPESLKTDVSKVMKTAVDEMDRFV